MHVSTLMKYFFDSDGCTRTCSIISTQHSGWDVFFVSLNGFSRLVNVYAHKHSVKLSIYSVLYCTSEAMSVSRSYSGPLPKSPTVLLVCVCTLICRIRYVTDVSRICSSLQATHPVT